MKKEVNQVSHTELQERCENLHVVLREQKEAKHMTNQDVSEVINVPVDRARKFFAGELKNPNVFGVMALCIHFGLSLDALLGNPYGQAGGRDEETTQLEHENEILKIKLEHEKENVRRAEATLERTDKSLKRTTTFIYILVGLCSVMVLALTNYFGIDIANPNIGFVRDTHIEPMGIIVAAIIVGGVAMVIAMIVGLFKEYRKKGEEKTAAIKQRSE